MIQESWTHSSIISLEITLTTLYQRQVMLISVKCLWITSRIKVPQSGMILQAALSTNHKILLNLTWGSSYMFYGEDVRRITTIQIKHPELDVVPTIITKGILDEILLIITHIC